jgi:hypothetical protein
VVINWGGGDLAGHVCSDSSLCPGVTLSCRGHMRSYDLLKRKVRELFHGPFQGKGE